MCSRYKIAEKDDVKNASDRSSTVGPACERLDAASYYTRSPRRSTARIVRRAAGGEGVGGRIVRTTGRNNVGARERAGSSVAPQAAAASAKGVQDVASIERAIRRGDHGRWR